MASIRERKKADGTRVFNVQVRMIGFPARTASFRSNKAAKAWATTIEAQMIEGKHFRNAEARRHTVAEAIDRYVLEELPRKRNGNMHRATLPWWKEQLGRIKLADISAASIVEARGKLEREPYQRAKPNSKRTSLKDGDVARTFKRTSSTVNRYLASLAHVFTVARKEWHWIAHNPFDGVSKLGENKTRTRHLSDDERTRLLKESANDPALHCFVVIALSTACRAGELLKLTWPDVNLKEGQLLFRETKNAEPRTAWLHGEALRLLKEHARVRRIDTDQVFCNPSGRGPLDYNKSFRAACVAAKVEGFRFHDLRHTAATELARMGATEQQLRAIGGWKSGVVSRYVHLAANDAKEVLAKMNKKILGT